MQPTTPTFFSPKGQRDGTRLLAELYKYLVLAIPTEARYCVPSAGRRARNPLATVSVIYMKINMKTNKVLTYSGLHRG